MCFMDKVLRYVLSESEEAWTEPMNGKMETGKKLEGKVKLSPNSCVKLEWKK